MRSFFALLVGLALFAADALSKSPGPGTGAQKSAAYKNAVKESTDRALAMYPDFDKKETPLGEAVQDEIKRQKETNPHFFDNTDWPERIANACAAVLGIKPAKPK